MKLLFKQRFFSWFDSYDIYDGEGNVIYTVHGKLAWGHRLEIHDQNDEQVAILQERLMTFLPKFHIEIGGQSVGTITKEFTFLKPSFSLDCNGWRVEGSFWEWDYRIIDCEDNVVAYIDKQLLNFTDTYTIDVAKSEDALLALMVVLAIDAVKCGQN